MNKKYLCPKHVEKTPSANVYGNGYFCFGCGAYGPVSELGLPAGERIEVTYVEDLEASIKRIKSLERKPIRGFSLHSSGSGYYLLWDNDSYYKYRNLLDDSPGGKYRGPAGITKPWFWAKRNGSQAITLVEGEFNALSLAECLGALTDIVSPGGAGDFYSKSANQYLLTCMNYARVNIVVDDDKAGAQAAIEATSKLKALGHRDVKIFLVKEDFNDVHVKKGLETLRAEAYRMGLCPGM